MDVFFLFASLTRTTEKVTLGIPFKAQNFGAVVVDGI